MYLVDTNVWLERLLNQARSDDVGKFLNEVSTVTFTSLILLSTQSA